MDWSALRRTRWQDYALRFLFGGLATVLTGWLAQRFGPVFGGLFLALPAIFPASATLIEKHEREKKRRHGISDPVRARKVAALDASGVQLGGCAMLAFAALLWQALPRANPWGVLCAASASWLGCGMLLWWLRKLHPLRRALLRLRD